MSRVVWNLIIAVFLLRGVVGCDDSPVPDGATPPPPYAPPEQGAPPCELSADCPSGTHCDLGECVQNCNTEDPCSEDLICHPRGACVVTIAQPLDLAPTSEFTSVVTPTAPMVYVDQDGAVASFSFASEPGDTPIRYRADPQVDWLDVSEPRGVFTGSLTVSVDVNRSGLGPGSHTGSFVLRTEVGDVVVPVHVEQGVSGVYQGMIEYESPRGLGRIPFGVEMVEDEGFVDVRVVTSRSPTFPAIDGRNPTATGVFEEGRLSLSLAQVLDDATLSLGGVSLGHEIGRLFEVTLESAEGAGFAGTFNERWIGLFASPAEVQGRVTLTRLADQEPGEFTVELPPELPENPSIEPPAITGECQTAAAAATALECTATSDTVEFVTCGQALLDIGEQWEGRPLLSEVPGDTNEYQVLAERCSSELDAVVETPTGTSDDVDCVRLANLACAVQFFGAAARLDDQNGYDGLSQVVSALSGLGMLLANERMVEAFEKPFEQEVDVASAMIESFQSAREPTQRMLSILFEPFLLASLYETHPSTAGSSAYRGLRRLAQILALDRSAGDQRSALLIRTGSSAEREAVISQINAEAPALLVTLVTLSAIEVEQSAPALPEVESFADAMTRMGRRALEATEPADVLGLPSGYIPFIYDPSMAGPERSTNFLQVLANHQSEVDDAVASEQAARAAVRDYDQTIEQLELASLVDTANRRLLALCGADAADPALPDLAHCGELTGEIAIARNQIEEEAVNIDIAMSRIEALAERVRIQTQRMNEVFGIRLETIAFVDETNTAINALEVVDIALEAAQQMIELSANASLVNWTAAAMGVASAIIQAVRGGIALQQDMLRQAQQMQYLVADAQIEYINGMATIQEMLVGMVELDLELSHAVLRATTAQIQLATLEEEVQTVEHEHEMLESRSLDVLANDPSFRVTRSRAVSDAFAARERAQRGVYLAARAFEFETNSDLSDIIQQLVGAMTAEEVADYASCLSRAFVEFREAYGTPTSFTNEVSLREDILGIHGPIEDQVTGEVVSEAEQFRRRLLAPSNLSPDGSVTLSFATTLNPGNGVFNTNVCNDQLRSIRVKIIGDGLGDSEASVVLQQGDTSFMRSCDSGRGGREDTILEYDITPSAFTVIQAGVNDYPAGDGDAQLYGRSVAASEWRLSIPVGSVAPQNEDLDVSMIDDIIIEITHSAISLSEEVIDYDPSCD